MQDTQAFAPFYKVARPAQSQTGTLFPSVTVSVTSSAANSGTIPGAPNGSAVQIQIANKTSSWAHVNFGVDGAVVAATVASSYPVAPGSVVVVTVDPEVSGASVILDSAAGAATSVIFTRGGGL